MYMCTHKCAYTHHTHTQRVGGGRGRKRGKGTRKREKETESLSSVLNEISPSNLFLWGSGNPEEVKAETVLEPEEMEDTKNQDLLITKGSLNI